MEHAEIRANIQAEINKLQKVPELLDGNSSGRGRASGKKRRTMSAEGRAKIAAAQRARLVHRRCIVMAL